jgi:hypothetical protein
MPFASKDDLEQALLVATSKKSMIAKLQALWPGRLQSTLLTRAQPGTAPPDRLDHIENILTTRITRGAMSGQGGGGGHGGGGGRVMVLLVAMRPMVAAVAGNVAFVLHSRTVYAGTTTVHLSTYARPVLLLPIDTIVRPFAASITLATLTGG